MRKVRIILCSILIILFDCFIFLGHNEIPKSAVDLYLILQSDTKDQYQVYYSESGVFEEEKSVFDEYKASNMRQTLKFSIPRECRYIRLDLGTVDAKIELKDIYFKIYNKKLHLNYDLLADGGHNMIDSMISNNGKVDIVTCGNDPYIAIDISTLNLEQFVKRERGSYELLQKIMICFFTNAALIFLFLFSKGVLSIPIELVKNRQLIWNLALNDFKTRYAGSYLGIIWAFIQPIVTILVYWFVFQVAFKSAPIGNYPYVLWLIAGLIPWFFFSEALSNATNSMIEYSYLVKKVVFKISILPIVKIFSATFVHLFFLILMFFIFFFCGHKIDLYSVQSIYYTFCMFVIVLAISYATCSVVVFFRDLGQIIAIILQVGVWMTPIMWNYTMIPENYQWVFKLNPMYYVVMGYRDAFINKVWFWNHLGYTIYFWILSVVLLCFGTTIFRKIKVHFADVL